MVRVTFHHFAYISAMPEPMLTKFRQHWWWRGRQKKAPSSDLENVGHGHHLQNIAVSHLFYYQLYQSFIEIMPMWSTQKKSLDCNKRDQR